MRSHSRLAVFASAQVIALTTSILIPSSAQAIEMPAAESSLFMLDVSGSTNSIELWKNLRMSVTSKLNQPFGKPISNSGTKKIPIDVSVMAIAKNSQNSPIFSIVTKEDSKKIWGTVDQLFKLNESRINDVSDSLFGESGTWATQAKIFTDTAFRAPSAVACRTSAISTMNTGTLIKNSSGKNKVALADAICERDLSISKGLKDTDAYFAKSVCGKKEVCSDVAGAIYRATSKAKDLAAQKKDKVNGVDVKNKLCIAIASDMLNESPGVSMTSVLNSEYIAKTSATTAMAKESGAAAARAVGIKFTSEVTTRVVMVGIGSGPNPLPLDRNRFLLAYWEGFFTQSGVKQTNQAQSIDQACA